MKNLINILSILILISLFLINVTSTDEVLREKWKDFRHEILIKSIEHIDPEDRTVIRNESNLNNIGVVLETDDYNYIVFNGLHLEKTDKKLDTVEVLLSKSQGYHMGNLQLMDQWLFFTSDGIHRINVKTKEKEQLYSDGVMDFYLTEEYIYFIDYKRGLNLFRMGLNGENLQRINTSLILDLSLTDTGFLAVTELENQNQLIHIDFDGQSEVLVSPFSGNQLIKLDSEIYYLDNQSDYLVKMNLTTQAKEILVDDLINYFAMDNEDIYYSLREETDEFNDALGIYKLTKEGDILLLDDETLMSTGNLSILGDYIYYESDFKREPFANNIVKKDGSERILIDRCND